MDDHRSAATQVFAIPELCGLILACLDKEDLFIVQNTTRGTRGYIHDYLQWRILILHKDAVSGRTVKPVRTSNPKTASWEYADDESEEGEDGGESQTSMTEVAPPSAESTQPPTQAAQWPTQAAQSSVEAASFGDATSTGAETLLSRFSRLAFGDGSSSTAAPSSSSNTTPPSANTSSASSSATSTPVVVPSTSSSTTSTPAIAPSTSASATPRIRNRSTLGGSSVPKALPPQIMPEINWLIKEKFPKCSYYASVNLLGLEEEVPMGGYFTNPDASYRPLLLMYPPIAKLRVHDYRSNQFMVHNLKGITVGDVVDAIFADQFI